MSENVSLADASLTVAGSILSTFLGNEAVVTSSSVVQPTTIPLEDCICPICLDYFIDVVQTGCQHRFCNFCLENWLHVSHRRQCPTCRRHVDNIQRLPEVDGMVAETIRSVLGEQVVQERNMARFQRRAQLDRFAEERTQTQSLIARITASRNQVRHRHATANQEATSPSILTPQTENLLSRHILSWWDDLHANEENIVVPISNGLDAVEIEELPSDWWQNMPARLLDEGPRQIPPRPETPAPLSQRNRNTNDISFAANSIPVLQVGDNSVPANHRSLMSDLEQHVYQDNLMEEYNYHLRRINSAYNRIREGYRDFNYHNGRLQHIFEEYRSHFGRVPNEINITENNVVDYEDFEDLLRAEMGELVDSSPIARVFGRASPVAENSLSSEPQNGMTSSFFATRMQHLRAHQRVERRPSANGSFRRELERVQAEIVPSPLNVLEMEQEIQNRRQQFNGMFSGARRFNTSNNTSSSGSTTGRHLFNEDQTSSSIFSGTDFFDNFSRSRMNPTRDDTRSARDYLRSTVGQQHLPAGRTGSEHITTTASRRMRRRPVILDGLRENDGFSGIVTRAGRGSLITTGRDATPITRGSTPTHRLALSQNLNDYRERRTITARRRLANNNGNTTSESESEHNIADNPGTLATRLHLLRRHTSGRSLSGPQLSARRLLRLARRRIHPATATDIHNNSVVVAAPVATTRAESNDAPSAGQGNLNNSVPVNSSSVIRPIALEGGATESRDHEAVSNNEVNVEASPGPMEDCVRTAFKICSRRQPPEP